MKYKYTFEDGGYIEAFMANGKVYLTLAAKNSDKPTDTIINSVEWERDQFLEMFENFVAEVKSTKTN